MKLYSYTSIKLIDGKIKAVCNVKEEPSFYKWLTNEDYLIQLVKWQQNHEVFDFYNPHEEGKIMRCIGGMNPQIKYGLEVTCIEIKDDLAYFKDIKCCERCIEGIDKCINDKNK